MQTETTIYHLNEDELATVSGGVPLAVSFGAGVGVAVAGYMLTKHTNFPVVVISVCCALLVGGYVIAARYMESQNHQAENTTNPDPSL